jgi:methyl-accepting chemotaxis protein
LDRHFQLKYSGYLVGIAALLSIGLGALLWSTSKDLVEQSREAVRQGQQVVALGSEVVEESRKVHAVVEMNIVEDPVYADNPELREAFQADADKQTERQLAQQKALADQAQALHVQARSLERKRKALLTTLFVALAALILGVGLAGIVVTHKIAGPIYKMRRQLRELGEGRIRMPAPLRKGDELGDFFETFREMVQRLRTRQGEEIAMLDAAVDELRGKVDDARLKKLQELRADMQAQLE